VPSDPDLGPEGWGEEREQPGQHAAGLTPFFSFQNSYVAATTALSRGDMHDLGLQLSKVYF